MPGSVVLHFVWYFAQAHSLPQWIQHAAARVVLNQHSHMSSLSSSKLLKQLHWFPSEWRIRFKLATLTFKSLHTGRPPYLSSLLQHRERSGLRAHLVLIIFQSPRHDLKFRSRAFQSSAPRVWNSLPVSIHESQSFTTFRRHLKTFYFQLAYPLSAVHLA